jgi:hypothetical protein
LRLRLLNAVAAAAMILAASAGATSGTARHVTHEALWRCIAGYPGARSDGESGESRGDNQASNGSHFGILQMTDPWGTGTYRVLDARRLSPQEVMRRAELAYRASGYSRAWLAGQWGATVGACWQYA